MTGNINLAAGTAASLNFDTIDAPQIGVPSFFRIQFTNLALNFDDFRGNEDTTAWTSFDLTASTPATTKLNELIDRTTPSSSSPSGVRFRHPGLDGYREAVGRCNGRRRGRVPGGAGRPAVGTTARRPRVRRVGEDFPSWGLPRQRHLTTDPHRERGDRRVPRRRRRFPGRRRGAGRPRPEVRLRLRDLGPRAAPVLTSP